MPTPRTTVVVPVRNRRDLLIQLLDALEKQSYRDFEVVVVDDGSTDGAADEVLRRQGGEIPFVLLRSGGAGAVAARRVGVAEARGEILAFTDSDCVPDREWLAAGVRAVDGGADMVNGLTEPTREVGPLERSLGSAHEGLYPTANMFFRRSTYERFGGFDQAAAGRLKFRVNERARGTGFGEDTILAWKMVRAGVPHIHAPDAIVRHQVFPPDPVEWLSRGMQIAAFPALVHEVPELRRTLLRKRVYLGSRNRVPVYLTVAAVLLGRRRTAAGTVLWWAASRVLPLRRVPGPWRRKLAWLPAEMALDVVITFSLLLGSARTGEIVL